MHLHEHCICSSLTLCEELSLTEKFKFIFSADIPGLTWLNKEKNIFRMPWKHAGRQDYNLEDSKIFMEWAKHSGRYREGIDKPEPIVWKTRLRCALNKMPDIRELPDMSRLDISDPYRVYELLPAMHKGKGGDNILLKY